MPLKTQQSRRRPGYSRKKMTHKVCADNHTGLAWLSSRCEKLVLGDSPTTTKLVSQTTEHVNRHYNEGINRTEGKKMSEMCIITLFPRETAKIYISMA